MDIVCPSCNHIYHNYSISIGGKICMYCGAEIVPRSDTDMVIKNKEMQKKARESVRKKMGFSVDKENL